MRLPCLAGCVGASVGAALHAQLRSIKVTCNHINYVLTVTRFLAHANSYTTQYKVATAMDLNQIRPSCRGVAT